LPSITSRSLSALKVRSPSVWAALAMASSVALTATPKLDADIDAQAVLGDQRCPRPSAHLQPQGAHVHLGDLVEVGQRDGAAGHDDLLPAEAGADQADLARGLSVEPRENHDHDDRDDDDKNEGCQGSGHGITSWVGRRRGERGRVGIVIVKPGVARLQRGLAGLQLGAHGVGVVAVKGGQDLRCGVDDAPGAPQ
jgi:hypothetical protein